MLQQNSLLLGQTHSMQTITPYTFTTGELDSLRGKLQLAEHHSKNSQSIVQLSLSEIRTLQKMIDMTSSGVLPSIQHEMNPSLGIKSGGSTATPPSNYICHKCNIPGHYVHDCPNVIGHWIQDCPLGNQQDYTKPPPPGYCCYRCGIPGHWIKTCPTNTMEVNGNQRDSPNFGQRDKKIIQQSNSQQLNVLTKSSGYLDNDTKNSDLNTRINDNQGDNNKSLKNHHWTNSRGKKKTTPRKLLFLVNRVETEFFIFYFFANYFVFIEIKHRNPKGLFFFSICKET
ncbi:hypothetical protein RFI_24243 [Reticulomyxa filosa]|uniref:CCHC-type domain-containing protein n=1 Tax=Reticulomyxa filosa TaxID=46433 RepID=X6MGI5_RETFI|nr:hypothetical protein RFI_24243 [Reticulomyxa filosa]|eukprot:ETO13133.1 hypothetical protein RFI_24243 [Reticulomyxa filosa]